MPLLSRFQVTVGNETLEGVTYIKVFQDAYTTGEFEVYCRFEVMENPDGFLIEQSKKMLGKKIQIQTELHEPKSTSAKPGFKFHGIITEVQGVKTGLAESNGILLFGKSPEILLENRPKTRTFIDSTVKDIVNAVLTDYDQGLLNPKVKPGNKQKFSYLVQYNETDLEFLRRLSIMFGEWFFFNGSDLIFGELSPREIDLTVGVDMDKFNINLKAGANNFELKTVDVLNNKVLNSPSSRVKTDSELNTYGKFARDVSGQIYPGVSVYEFSHWNVKDPDIQDAVNTSTDLDARAGSIHLTTITGQASHPGMSVGMVGVIKSQKQNKPGTVDYGKYLFSRVYHIIDNLNNYSNSFCGTPKESSLPENTNPRLFRNSGPHMAEVTDNEDPEKLGRIRAKFSWMSGDECTPWIPVLTPYVTGSAGIYFIPPVGSLVLVDFEGSNIDKPFCAGSLFNKKVSPDSSWAGNMNEGNAKIHAIRTEGGNTIEFHDDKGSKLIKIYDTDGKNEVVLDSTNGEITVKATERITLDAKEIILKASDTIKIEAGKDLKQEGTNISISAKSKLESSAANVEISADASIKLEGSASAKLASSGVMTIQGSVVKIN